VDGRKSPAQVPGIGGHKEEDELILGKENGIVGLILAAKRQVLVSNLALPSFLWTKTTIRNL